MGPTRKRDLTAATVVVAIVGYLLVSLTYRVVPADHGLDRAVAARGGAVEAGWAFYVRSKISEGRSATAPDGCIRWRWREPVMIAKASAWVGAIALGWWAGVLAYVLPKREPAAGRGRGQPGCGGCRGECAGAGGRGAVAAALLQVTGRAARRPRRRPELAR